jgi:hypothetical protein
MLAWSRRHGRRAAHPLGLAARRAPEVRAAPQLAVERAARERGRAHLADGADGRLDAPPPPAPGRPQARAGDDRCPRARGGDRRRRSVPDRRILRPRPLPRRVPRGGKANAEAKLRAVGSTAKGACKTSWRVPEPRTSLDRRQVLDRRSNRYSPDGLGRYPKRCSSAGPRSRGGHVRRRIPGARGRWTPTRRRIRAALVPLVDLGAWFSPRLRPPPWFAPVRPPPRAVLASGRSGAGSPRKAPAAPPPRPAGTPDSGRGARAGRRSSRASRARS